MGKIFKITSNSEVMLMPLSDLADKLTILRIKKGYKNSEEINNELQEINKSLEEYSKKGIEIDSVLIDKLALVNRELWDLVSELAEANKNEGKLEVIGRIYIKQHIANKKRIAIKNQIVRDTGIGFKDISVNYLSKK